MKKQTILIFFLLLCPIIIAQTGKRLHVDGTNCSLIPPKGFEAATEFSGFINEEYSASIMVVEVPANYSQLTGSFSREALAASGMTLQNSTPLKIDGQEASLLEVSQVANGTNYLKQILLFGNGKKTVMLNGTFPEIYRDKMAEEMKKALLSASYNSAQNSDPSNSPLFSIDTENNGFKFSQNIGGTMLYTVDGEMTSQQAILIAGSSFGQSVAADKQEEYAKARLKKLPDMASCEIKETKAIAIDGLKGYEIVAENGNSDERMLTYQVMLFTPEGNYHMVVGQTTEEFERNLATFRKIAHTFKQK